MPLFENSLPISPELISTVVKLHWNLNLGSIIKASQNHTFNAEDDIHQKFIVRVTPDPFQNHQKRIEDEVNFVRFMVTSGLPNICGPIPSVCLPMSVASSVDSISTAENCIVRSADMIIVVFSWAKGHPLNFLEFRWMLDEEVVRSVGSWFALFHRYSSQFSTLFPEIANRIQLWSQIHDGVLAAAPIDPLDQAVVNDPNQFGIIHGDLNCSNYFYDDELKTISVFDWDQTQRGWYLWDVAQACFTVVMLHEAGMPIAGTPVPEANPTRFMELLASGYEAVAGIGSVDITRLNRMIALRKEFYERFCRQAQSEGNVPPDMAAFIDFIVEWFDRAGK